MRERTDAIARRYDRAPMRRKKRALLDAAVTGLLLGAAACSADSDKKADTTDPALEMSADGLTPTSLKSDAGVEKNCAGRCAGRCAGASGQTKKN
jgi:hypothetical protein